MVNGRSWTKEDVTLLEDQWGVYSIRTIAKRLDRTINAVKLKAQRVGLPDARYSFDGITLNQLAIGINISYSILKNWVERYEFPAKKKLFVDKSRVLVVRYKDFWDWAERNKQMLDFNRIEPLILGPEPDWVQEKRKADQLKKFHIKKSHNNAWSKEEDSTLIGMLNAYQYTYPEIASRLHRSQGAVKRRIHDLNLKQRPVRLPNHVKYTTEDIKTILIMTEKGHCLEEISEKINKSALGIRGKLERMGYKFKNGVPVKISKLG